MEFKASLFHPSECSEAKLFSTQLEQACERHAIGGGLVMTKNRAQLCFQFVVCDERPDDERPDEVTEIVGVEPFSRHHACAFSRHNVLSKTAFSRWLDNSTRIISGKRNNAFYYSNHDLNLLSFIFLSIESDKYSSDWSNGGDW
ncbi:hypothetical protein Bca4012_064959 [Brassica carinata]